MEVSEYQNQGNNIATEDFKIVIRNVEINNYNNLVLKKNKILMKKKMRDLWLFRSKIIPPSFQRFSKQNYSQYDASINLKAKNNTADTQDTIFDGARIRTEEIKYRSIEPQSDFNSKMQIRRSRRQYGRSEHNNQKIEVGSYRKILSCDQKVRKPVNWKLQYRMDELNILKFTKSTHEQEAAPVKSASQQLSNIYKIKKLNKKYKDLRLNSPDNFRPNIVECKSDLHIKTSIQTRKNSPTHFILKKKHSINRQHQIKKVEKSFEI